jgi:hypothetical protein
MVYGETFLRNFKFYAKTLTKLHDLTVPVYVYALILVKILNRTCNLTLNFLN